MAATKKKLAVTTAPLAETEGDVPEERQEEIDVSPTASDDDDDEEGGLEAAEPEVEERRASRRERRRNRLKEIEDAANERVRVAEEARQRAEIAAAHAQGLRDAEAERQRQAQEDPDDAEIKRARARKEELSTLYNALPPEQQQARYAELQAQVNEANEQEIAAINRRENRRNGVGRGPDPRAVYRAQVLEEIAGDILRSPPHVQQWGLAKVQQLIMEGYPDNKETAALAAEYTRKQFGMASRAPSNGKRQAQSRSTMTTVTSNGNGEGNGNGERQVVKMTPEFSRIARARFPKLPPAEAEKEWAKRFAKHQQKQGG